MFDFLFAALIDLQGHDHKPYRELATEVSWRLNNSLDLRRHVSRGLKSKDAEIRRRCRWVRDRYERMLPKAGHWPRIHSVSVEGYEWEIHSVKVQFDCVNDRTDHEHWREGWDSEDAAREDVVCRLASEELATRLLQDGYTRWQILRIMDRAVAEEAGRGSGPNRFQPAGGWGEYR